MKKIRSSSNIVALAMLFIAGIVAIVPYLTANTLHSGVDMSFHLNRIYDLAQNIKNGNYFSYIETYANNQVGVPINMVYGALPLYPFSLMLNIFSNKIIAIYLGYLVIVWISLMISYYVGLKYWQKDEKRAILFAVVYVLSTYNFSWMFGTFDLGQVSGYVFLPLIVYGTYSIFYRSSREWWLLSIGMIGLIYSHMLSTLIYSFLVGVLVIIALFTAPDFWKKIKYFLYAVMVSLLGTAFYWSTLYCVYNSNKLFITKSNGIPTAGLKFGDAILSIFNNDGSIGVLLGVLLIIGLVLWKKQNAEAKVAAVIGIVFLLATTNIFDFAWNFINKTPLTIIQWPGRLLCVVNFFIAVFATETLFILISESKHKNKGYILSVIIAIFVVLSNSYTFLNTHQQQPVVNYEPSVQKQLPFTDYQITSNVGFNYLVTGYNQGVGSIDYWPEISMKDGSVVREIVQHIAIINTKKVKLQPISITDGINYQLTTNKKDSSVDLPFLNYNSYEIQVDGRKENYFKTRRGTIGVKISKIGQHEIKIKYVVPKMVKAAMIISWLTVILLLLFGIIRLLFRNTAFYKKRPNL